MFASLLFIFVCMVAHMLFDSSTVTDHWSFQ